MVDALAVIAAGWGLLMGMAPTLQIRRILQRQSSADVSIGSLLVLQVGFTCWLAYGIAISNYALILSNGVALLVGSVTLYVTWHYRSVRR